jgi:hypothetical protein
MHIKSKKHNSIAMFFPKNLMAGFEPGFAVSEADAASTAPLHQGEILHLLNVVFLIMETSVCY